MPRPTNVLQISPRRLTMAAGLLIAAAIMVASPAMGELPAIADPTPAEVQAATLAADADARVSVAIDEVVTAQLVSSVDAVVPGEPFVVGVRLLIAPPWHVYWKYPGDAGVATKAQLRVPDGFQVDEPRYPLPKQFMQPGELAGYGYENETVLLFQVTPPATLAVDTAVPISATVSFLRCTNVCIPGKAELQLTLAVSPTGLPAIPSRWVDHWQSRLPAVERPEVTDLILTAPEPGIWVIRAKMQTPEAAESVQWYPLPPSGLVIRQTEQWTTGSSAVLSLAVGGKVPQPAEMGVLLVYTDPAHRRVGVERTVRELPLPGE